jgi:uncharacterized membrane protein YfcA
MFEYIALIILAFFFETIDNGLGGGVGTIMSPLLIILGYDAKIVVPAILLSETVSGLWGGIWHAKFKNINYKAYGTTLVGSLVAMVVASYLIGTYLPSTVVKWYISILALFMGIFVIYRSYGKIKALAHSDDFSKKKTMLLGFIIGFNKGSTGGGYGPLSVSGYILIGLPAAVAIGTTTLAEGTASLLGVATYGLTIGVALSLALPLTLGSILADPFSAWLNNKLREQFAPPFHGRIVGIAMTVLGIITLIKLLGYI